MLRAADLGDAGGVGAILSEFVDRTDWMPRLHSRAQDIAHAEQMIARGWVTVAERAGRIVGFAACDGEELNALYVAESARWQGVGKALLRHVQTDRPMVRLWTFQANTAAQQFYLRHGFVETQRTDGAGNDEHLPDVRFEWVREAA